MSTHDYSCFFCSIEGEKNLTIWLQYRLDNNEYCDYPPKSNDPPQGGDNSCYTFLFPKDSQPLENWAYPISCKKVGYNWDQWDFKGRKDETIGYNSILRSKFPIKSIWPSSTSNSKFGNKWILNLCPHCFGYFIDDSKIDSPPELLCRIMIKFGLLPYKKFSIYNILDNFKSTNNIYMTTKFYGVSYDIPLLSHFFPLKRITLHNYIRAFADYLGLRAAAGYSTIIFRFKNYARNPAVARLDSGGYLLDDDPNFPGRKLDRSICRPLDIALERKDVRQIIECLSKGAIVSRRQLDIILSDSKYSGIIAKFAHTFDREMMFDYYSTDNRWLKANPQFFRCSDIDNIVNNVFVKSETQDTEFLEYLITLFPEEYKFESYYTLISYQKKEHIRVLLDFGFNAQTHFAMVVNMQWVEGILMFQEYGAEKTEEVDEVLKKKWIRKETRKLFDK